MSMKEIVYLDMDGVLSNFSSRYKELFGIMPAEARKKNWDVYWEEFVGKGNFSTLEWFPGGQELYAGVVEYTKKHHIRLDILTSAGGEKMVEDIAHQKRSWLIKNNIKHDYMHVVPGKRFKRNFALPTTVIIDDTESVIREFREDGGDAIHHLGDVDKTLSKLWSGNYED